MWGGEFEPEPFWCFQPYKRVSSLKYEGGYKVKSLLPRAEKKGSTRQSRSPSLPSQKSGNSERGILTQFLPQGQKSSIVQKNGVDVEASN